MNGKFEKWDKWIDVLYSQVMDLSTTRYIFWEVQKIIKNNSKIQKPSAFYNFLGNGYVTIALSSIRRQLKVDQQSISFARLLIEISENPKIISRERYISNYEGSNLGIDIGHLDFDSIAGKGSKHIDSKIPLNDHSKLKNLAKACEGYADRRISHYDKRDPKLVPTFNDIDICVDYLENLLKKYYSIFRATVISQFPPIFQYDWRSIFKETWLKDENNA